MNKQSFQHTSESHDQEMSEAREAAQKHEITLRELQAELEVCAAVLNFDTDNQAEKEEKAKAVAQAQAQAQRTPPVSPRRVPESPGSIEKLHLAHQAKVNELEQ